MDDDKKLKIVFYLIVFLAAVAVIGVWEFFIQPLWEFVASMVIIR